MRKDLFGRYTAPPHPGEVIREEILPEYGLTRKALAEAIGVSARIVGEVCAERRAITADLAARLDRALGGGVHYWLGLQCQHDIYVARALDVERVRKLAPRRAARKSAAAEHDRPGRSHAPTMDRSAYAIR